MSPEEEADLMVEWARQTMDIQLQPWQRHALVAYFHEHPRAEG